MCYLNSSVFSPILRQTKIFFVELVNWWFITQSIQQYDGLTSDESIFLFLQSFFGESSIWFACFLFITGWLCLDTSSETTSWIVWQFFEINQSQSLSSISRMYIFWYIIHVLQGQSWYRFPIMHQFLLLNTFPFLADFLDAQGLPEGSYKIGSVRSSVLLSIYLSLWAFSWNCIISFF